MSRVTRDAPGIDDSHGIQHRTAVFVQQHSISNCFTNNLQSDALRFERRGVGAIVISLNRGVVHEIQLDVANSPILGERRISITQILLCRGISGVEYVKWIQISFGIRSLGNKASM